MSHNKRLLSVVTGITGIALLAACGPQTPEEAKAAAIEKCERQFGRMAPDPSGANSLCTCMTDRMAAEGLEITDMLGGGREKIEQITRSCAAQSGIPIPPG